MVVLHQLPRFWGLPNASPYCVKLKTWLRMTGVPHQARGLTGLPWSTTGKVPYVDLPDGTRMDDSARIIAELTRRHDVALDRGLDAAALARATVVTRLFEDSLFWAVAWTRWQEPGGFAVCWPAYFARLPTPLAWLLGRLLRRRIVGYLHGQGTGRRPPAEIVARGADDLRAAADLLGDRPWFLGSEPHGVDATTFGFLTNLRHAPFPGPLRDALHTHSNLLAFEERMRARYWPDWDDLR